MSGLRLGELCAGYGGLGLAVEEVFSATTAWFSEFDEAPSKILAHHWPDVPNYGDMTKIDWSAIEPVDIISGGTPCQDLSGAGKRAGMTEGTRSNLWVQMREAIAIQKPTYVVWENVRGAYSATAASDLEQCPGCMGDTGNGGPVLRALGRVLGDLSDLGYDTQWRGLRAADVGACHGRFRVFVLAILRPGFLTPSDTHGGRRRESQYGNQCVGKDRPREAAILDTPDRRYVAAENADLTARGERREPTPGQEEGGRARANFGGRGGALAAYTHSRHDAGREQDQERGAVWRVASERAGRSSDRRKAAADTESPKWRGAKSEDLVASSGSTSEPRECAGSDATQWGPYTPAIRRWEAVRGTAPSPTELTAKGNHRLSARFAEWMMGLPAGWVTDPAIGISRNEQLKACGNGVVPQQAMAALQDMLAAFETAEVAS